MALKIRLSRGGAKKRPFYRIVVADARSPRDGRFIERVGTYNPMVAKDSDDRVVLKEERIKYWLSQGAKPSDRVARFLGQAEIIQFRCRCQHFSDLVCTSSEIWVVVRHKCAQFRRQRRWERSKLITVEAKGI